jgi:signal transduction histidine kinase
LKRVLEGAGPDVEGRLQQFNETINQGIELKRRVIEDLRPSSLGHLGLAAALEILTREFAARSGLTVCAVLQPVLLPDSAQTTAYRFAQEGLANADRHAAAQHVTVTLEPQERNGRAGARVAVQDDGHGFDPAARRGTTHGLLGLRYRVESEGGELRMTSVQGQGACIEAWMPAEAVS